MSDDPLTSFISRSLRADVVDVRSEVVAKDARRELERIRFRDGNAARSLVITRVPPNDALEVQLLPLLARKSERAPRVFSRGIPPPDVPAWPWVLTEDLLDAPSACESDPRAIVRAKVEVERAVASDEPALRALGVTRRSASEMLARAGPMSGAREADARSAATLLDRLPVVFCHGDLGCANARLTDRGIVLTEWRRAHMGCGLLDIARLVTDVETRGDRGSGGGLFALYGELTGMTIDQDIIRAARTVTTAAQRPTT